VVGEMRRGVWRVGKHVAQHERGEDAELCRQRSSHVGEESRTRGWQGSWRGNQAGGWRGARRAEIVTARRVEVAERIGDEEGLVGEGESDMGIVGGCASVEGARASDGGGAPWRIRRSRSLEGRTT
jgi:hypothetical protein